MHSNQLTNHLLIIKNRLFSFLKVTKHEKSECVGTMKVFSPLILLFFTFKSLVVLFPTHTSFFGKFHQISYSLASQQDYISYISYIFKISPITDYILRFFPIFLYFRKNQRLFRKRSDFFIKNCYAHSNCSWETAVKSKKRVFRISGNLGKVF